MKDTKLKHKIPQLRQQSRDNGGSRSLPHITIVTPRRYNNDLWRKPPCRSRSMIRFYPTRKPGIIDALDIAPPLLGHCIVADLVQTKIPTFLLAWHGTQSDAQVQARPPRLGNGNNPIENQPLHVCFAAVVRLLAAHLYLAASTRRASKSSLLISNLFF